MLIAIALLQASVTTPAAPASAEEHPPITQVQIQDAEVAGKPSCVAGTAITIRLRESGPLDPCASDPAPRVRYETEMVRGKGNLIKIMEY